MPFRRKSMKVKQELNSEVCPDFQKVQPRDWGIYSATKCSSPLDCSSPNLSIPADPCNIQGIGAKILEVAICEASLGKPPLFCTASGRRPQGIARGFTTDTCANSAGDDGGGEGDGYKPACIDGMCTCVRPPLS